MKRSERTARAKAAFRPGDDVLWLKRVQKRQMREAHTGTVVSTLDRFTVLDWATGHWVHPRVGETKLQGTIGDVSGSTAR